jgi:hypothetical protein
MRSSEKATEEHLKGSLGVFDRVISIDASIGEGWGDKHIGLGDLAATTANSIGVVVSDALRNSVDIAKSGAGRASRNKRCYRYDGNDRANLVHSFHALQ